jgi:hypothetical protein
MGQIMAEAVKYESAERFGELRGKVNGLEERISRQDDHMKELFASSSSHMDKRFDTIDKRFDTLGLSVSGLVENKQEILGGWALAKIMGFIILSVGGTQLATEVYKNYLSGPSTKVDQMITELKR